MILIGHVEGDGFAIRSPSGTLETNIPFETIRLESARTDTPVIFIGCDTFSCTSHSGTIKPITDLDVSSSLTRAESAKTVGEYLAAFGSTDSPIVITKSAISSIQNRLNLKIERLARGSREARGGAILVRAAELVTLSAAATAAIWLFVYLGGIVFTALAEGSDGHPMWDAFLRHFPVLPNKAFRPRMFRIVSLLRVVLFYAIAPFIGLIFLTLILITAFNFSFSTWKKRDDIFDTAWLVILQPHKAIYNIFLMMIGLIMFVSRLTVFGVMLAVALSPFFFISNSTVVTTSILLCGGLIAIALAYFRKSILNVYDSSIYGVVMFAAPFLPRWTMVPLVFLLKSMPTFALFIVTVEAGG